MKLLLTLLIILNISCAKKSGNSSSNDSELPKATSSIEDNTDQTIDSPANPIEDESINETIIPTQTESFEAVEVSLEPQDLHSVTVNEMQSLKVTINNPSQVQAIFENFSQNIEVCAAWVLMLQGQPLQTNILDCRTRSMAEAAAQRWRGISRVRVFNNYTFNERVTGTFRRFREWQASPIKDIDFEGLGIIARINGSPIEVSDFNIVFDEQSDNIQSIEIIFDIQENTSGNLVLRVLPTNSSESTTIGHLSSPLEFAFNTEEFESPRRTVPIYSIPGRSLPPGTSVMGIAFTRPELTTSSIDSTDRFRFDAIIEYQANITTGENQ